MNRRVGRVVALAVVLTFAGCAAGNVYFQKGRQAALRKNWDNALINFEKAAQAQPENAEYQLEEQHARMQAAMFHVQQGREFLHQQRVQQAIGEFQKAVSIDPSNIAARQELARLLAREVAIKQKHEENLQQAIKASERQAQMPAVELKPLPREPLAHFRISADSKRVYETLCKLAGLNVAFTSDFQAQPVSMDLNNVTILNALHLLGLQTHTFWKVITANTILVVPDNPANRRDYQTQIVRTIYLQNSMKPADRTAITTALKQILGIQRIIDNPDANAIIIRDTPKRVQEAADLIHDLDHGKAEIMMDITVLEADADRVQELGLTPATVSSSGSITNGLQAGAIFNPESTASLAHLSTNDFSLVVPSAVANAILNDSTTRIIQNPEIQVTDGDTATLRIGSRIPYATGSFLPSLGVGSTSSSTSGGFGGLIASTQFQFQDVGVNVDLTPHLLPDGEIAIHAKIDISSVQPSVTIAGVNEPTFGQRQIEHDIRLEEGQTSVLGGLLQTTDTTTVSGVPGLGQIPGLRYLFSDTKHEKVKTDVLILLTPRVIRLPGPDVETAAAESPSHPVSKSSANPAAPVVPAAPAGPHPHPAPASPTGPRQLQ